MEESSQNFDAAKVSYVLIPTYIPYGYLILCEVKKAPRSHDPKRRRLMRRLRLLGCAHFPVCHRHRQRRRPTTMSKQASMRRRQGKHRRHRNSHEETTRNDNDTAMDDDHLLASRGTRHVMSNDITMGGARSSNSKGSIRNNSTSTDCAHADCPLHLPGNQFVGSSLELMLLDGAYLFRDVRTAVEV